MEANAIVDAGFLVALLNRRDSNHSWAVRQASEYVMPWRTCEAALSEVLFLLGEPGRLALSEIMRRKAVVCDFSVNGNLEPVLGLLAKYADVPMSLADASLVRMSETLANPVILTTDSDFRIYRRHSRLAIPCVLPGERSTGRQSVRKTGRGPHR